MSVTVFNAATPPNPSSGSPPAPIVPNVIV